MFLLLFIMVLKPFLIAFTLQVVKAEDPEGLFNTATVSVVIQDINDKNPDFIGLPYSFRVNEGEEDAVVGTVEVCGYVILGSLT